MSPLHMKKGLRTFSAALLFWAIYLFRGLVKNFKVRETRTLEKWSIWRLGLLTYVTDTSCRTVYAAGALF